MTCRKFNLGGMPGILCTTPLYEFEGCLFEWGRCGPAPVRRDTLDIRVTIPPGFWKTMERFEKLTAKQRQRYEK